MTLGEDQYLLLTVGTAELDVFLFEGSSLPTLKVDVTIRGREACDRSRARDVSLGGCGTECLRVVTSWRVSALRDWPSVTRDAWSIIQGHLATETALPPLTRVRRKTLADAEFGLRTGKT